MHDLRRQGRVARLERVCFLDALGEFAVFSPRAPMNKPVLQPQTAAINQKHDDRQFLAPAQPPGQRDLGQGVGSAHLDEMRQSTQAPRPAHSAMLRVLVRLAS
jgi:hypothetical protein